MAAVTACASEWIMRNTIGPFAVRSCTLENTGPSFLAFTPATVGSGITGGSLRALGSDEIDTSLTHSMRSRNTRTVEFFPSSRLSASITRSEGAVTGVPAPGASVITPACHEDLGQSDAGGIPCRHVHLPTNGNSLALLTSGGTTTCRVCPATALSWGESGTDEGVSIMERVVLGRRERSMIGFRWSGDEPKDLNDQELAEELGAVWEGDDLVTYNMASLIWQLEHLSEEYMIDND